MKKKKPDKSRTQIDIPTVTHARMKKYKDGHPLRPSLYAIADTAINEFLDAAEAK